MQNYPAKRDLNPLAVRSSVPCRDLAAASVAPLAPSVNLRSEGFTVWPIDSAGRCLLLHLHLWPTSGEMPTGDLHVEGEGSLEFCFT